MLTRGALVTTHHPRWLVVLAAVSIAACGGDTQPARARSPQLPAEPSTPLPPAEPPSTPQQPAAPLPRLDPPDASVAAEWALLLPDASRVVAAPNDNVVVTGYSDHGGSFGAALISRIDSAGRLTSMTAYGLGCGLYLRPVELANDGEFVAQADPHNCGGVLIGNGVLSTDGALLVLDAADDYVRTITDERVSIASDYEALPASDGSFLIRSPTSEGIRKVNREGATLWVTPGVFFGAPHPLPDGSMLAWKYGAVETPLTHTLVRISADGGVMWSMDWAVPDLGTGVEGRLAVQDAEFFVVTTRDFEQGPVVLARMSFAPSVVDRANTGTHRLTHLMSLADSTVLIAFQSLDSAGRLCARLRLYSPTLERLWEYGIDQECAARILSTVRDRKRTKFSATSRTTFAASIIDLAIAIVDAARSAACGKSCRVCRAVWRPSERSRAFSG